MIFKQIEGEHLVPDVDQAEQKNAPKSSEQLLEVHRGGCQDGVDLGPGPGLFVAVRARGQQGQHRQLSEPGLADRASRLARHAGRMPGRGAPTSGQNFESDLQAPPAGSLHGPGQQDRTSGKPQSNGKEDGKDGGKATLEIAARFPLSHPSGGYGIMRKKKTQNRTFHLLRKPDILIC